MSKKCPNCGSYNTELSAGNITGRAIVNTGRVAISAVAGMFGALLGPNMGRAASYSTWNNTDPGEFHPYHCNSCGKDFK